MRRTPHSRCNAHLLRELKACVEDGHLWAENTIIFRLAIKQAADQARTNGEKVLRFMNDLQVPFDND
jgi:hypothetical protein